MGFPSVRSRIGGLDGVALAGGLSRRMEGREKAFLTLGKEPILHRLLLRFSPQVGEVVLSANGDAERFADTGLRVIPDARPDYPGPLAGVEAAFLALPKAEWLLSVAVDLPFLPLDLAATLWAASEEGGKKEPVTVSSARRLHPVVTLWPRSVLPDLTAYLDAGERRLMAWFDGRPHRVVDFPVPEGGPDPFLNLNRPEDLERAEAIIAKLER